MFFKDYQHNTADHDEHSSPTLESGPNFQRQRAPDNPYYCKGPSAVVR